MMRRRRDQPHAGDRVPHARDVDVDLVPRQLTALAGLGALRDLDLHHVRVDQVLGRHSKAARGHLLDRRALRIAVRQRPEALGLLAALAGVRTPADAVHRNRQRGVRLGRDRAERHGAGRKAPDDLLGLLDLLKRNGLTLRREFQQPAQRHQPALLGVDQLGILFIRGEALAADRMLQLGDRGRRPHVRLGVLPIGVLAAVAQTVRRLLSVRLGMQPRGVARDLLEADALDLRDRPGKIRVDQVRAQPDRLEQLRAAERLDGGHPHLRHHLEQALAHRRAVVGDALRWRRRGVEPQLDLTQRPIRQIRTDGLGAEADQDREVMDLAGLGGVDHQAHPRPQARVDQTVMDGGQRQQGRDRQPLRRGRTIRQHQDHAPLAVRQPRRLVPHGVQRRTHAGRTLGCRIGQVDGRRRDAAVRALLDFHDPRQLLLVDHRRVQAQQMLLGLGVGLQQIRPRAQIGVGAHHQLFADRVDGRIGYLREFLAEVIGQLAHLGRQHRLGRVVPHRAHWLLAVGDHRLEYELEVLLGVPAGQLPAQQPLRIRRRRQLGRGHCRQVVQPQLVLAHPRGEGLDAGQLLLELGVADDALALEVDQQHLAGLQAPLVGDVLLRYVDHPDLRGHHQPAVGGLDIARRPQAVAVEQRPDLAPVGEGDQRRSVPGLHHGRMMLVEGLAVRRHGLVVLPGLGDHHRRRLRRRVAADQQQLQAVVERTRVGRGFGHQREYARQRVAEDAAADAALAGKHVVDVAAHGVDLAVVGDGAVRMRELPGREGVGRKALVDDRQRRLGVGVPQVRIVGHQLVGQEHALVDDGAARHRADVEAGRIVRAQLGPLDLLRTPAPRQVQPGVELLPLQPLRPAREQLLDHGLKAAHMVVEQLARDRDLAPGDDLQAELFELGGQQLLDGLPRGGALR